MRVLSFNRSQTRIACAIVLGFLDLSCGKKKSSDSPTAADQASGSEGGGSTETAPMAVSGSLAIPTSLALTKDAAISVLAISGDGERTEGTYDADTGAFNVDLDRTTDQNYVVALIDESKKGEGMIVATLKAGDMNSLSAGEDAKESLELGELTVTPATTTDIPTMTNDDALATTVDSLGISTDDSATCGKFDKAALKLANVDVDGNGKVDDKSDFDLSFSFGFTSATGDPNANSSTVSTYKNAFLPDTQVFQNGRFAITVAAKKSLFSSTPTSVVWKFSNPLQLDDSGTDITIDGVASSSRKETVPADKELTKAFSLSSNSSDNYEFGITVNEIPKGDYQLVVGGKTLQFKKVDVASYNKIPPVIPFLRLDVNDSNHMTAVNFKWMTRKADDSGWELATLPLVKMFVGKTGGFLSMYVMQNGERTTKKFEAVISPNELEGSIPFDAAHTCLGDTQVPAKTACVDDTTPLHLQGFSSVKDGMAQDFSAWGWNNFTFVDKFGMTIGVN